MSSICSGSRRLPTCSHKTAAPARANPRHRPLSRFGSRKVPIRRPNGVNGGIVEFEVAQHCFELAAPERLADDKGRQHDEPDALDRGVAQHVPVIDAESRCALSDAAPFALDAEAPLLGDRTIAVDEAIVAVALQFLWRARLAASL